MRGCGGARGIAGCLAGALLLACASPRPPIAPESVDLTFLDSRSFDQQLSSTLAAGPTVVAVDFIADVSPNALPERIDRWLYAVSSRGGPVRAERDPRLARERAFGADVAITLALRTYAHVREQMIYRRAAGHAAIVYVDPAHDRVTRVLFFRMPSP